jgi:pilus assembly protein CpaF
MSLMQRVERAQQQNNAAAPPAGTPAAAPPTPPTPPVAAAPPASPAAPVSVMHATNPVRAVLLHEVRLRLQEEIVTAFNELLDVPHAEVRLRIQGIVDRIVDQNGYAVTREERAHLVEEMVHDVTGFGPLEPLLNDETITEVMVNGPSHIYIERAGRIERIDSVFLNDEHVLRVIDRIIAPMGRRIDETSPRGRRPPARRLARQRDHRAAVARRPRSSPVRKFSKTPYTVDDLVSFGTATPRCSTS